METSLKPSPNTTTSILGPVNSALYGDETYLLTNATLDLVSSMVFGATFGFGIAIAAVVLFCWQSAIYLLAGALAPLMGDEEHICNLICFCCPSLLIVGVECLIQVGGNAARPHGVCADV